jgi:hypothetical protein
VNLRDQLIESIQADMHRIADGAPMPAMGEGKACEYCEARGHPKTYTESFKYEEKTGYDAAKWMCDYCWTNGLPLPEFNCHSANPVGRENILAILNSHKERLND